MFPFTVAELRNCPSPPLENGPWARGDIFRFWFDQHKYTGGLRICALSPKRKMSPNKPMFGAEKIKVTHLGIWAKESASAGVVFQPLSSSSSSSSVSFLFILFMSTHFADCLLRQRNFIANVAFASSNKLCAWRHNMPPSSASWQYLRIYSPGGTACWLFKTSARSWPLTFWPWKWCPSHLWRGLPLCQFQSS